MFAKCYRTLIRFITKVKYNILFDVRIWHTSELHVVKLHPIKQPFTNGLYWPDYGGLYSRIQLSASLPLVDVAMPIQQSIPTF